MHLLTFLNYSGPAALIVSQAGVIAYDLWNHPADVSYRPPMRLKRWRAITACAIACCFIGRSVEHISRSQLAEKDADVYTLWQSLLWSSWSIMILNDYPGIIQPHTAVCCLGLALESTVCLLSIWGSQKIYSINLPRCILMVTTCALLALLALITIVAAEQRKTLSCQAESSKLISRSNKSLSTTHSYDSIATADHTDDRSTSFTAHDPNYGDDGDDSDSDDDDESREAKELRMQRVQSSGWTGYLSDYLVFWPMIWPKDNARLQAFVVSSLFLNTIIRRVLTVLHPRQLGIVVDKLSTSRDIPWKDICLWIVLAALASESAGLEAICTMLNQRITANACKKLSVTTFQHIMSLSMSFHDTKDSGEVIKAVEQADAMTSLLQVIIVEILPGILDIFIAIWYISYLLDAYAVIIVVAAGVSFTIIGTLFAEVNQTTRRKHSLKTREQSKILYESMSNWTNVCYFNRQDHEASRLMEASEKVATASVRNEDTYVAMFGAQEICDYLSRFAISILAAYRYSQGLATIGDFVSLQNYWEIIMQPFWVLGYSYRQIARNLVDAERLISLFRTIPTVQDAKHAKPLLYQQGQVDFVDVNFAYDERKTTLENFTFTVAPGKRVALVGETGSGKSTTLKLLMRFVDVTSGSILIDGQNIRDVTQHSLREYFGFVPQDIALFNFSILENVRYGRLDATDEEVFDACKAASIHEKILSMPDGYGTKVGERGEKLSGGEAQRIAIARVLLKNARIVLLDEATSAIDSQTESRIQDALEKLLHNRTALIIAHRLSTIMNADTILVIDKGRIVEQGTHGELLQLGGVYLDLWMKQTQHVSLAEHKDAPISS